MVIAIDLLTLLAAAYVASPACDAVIEQVPAITTFIAPFTTVQMLKVVEVKVIGYEPVALLLATNGCGLLVTVIAVGGVKVMV